MDPVGLIAFWAVLFFGTHLIISSNLVRPRLIAAVGEMPYRGIYSLAAFGTLIPLIIVFANHKHSGPILWFFRADAPLRWIVWLAMLLAFIFLVAGLVTPSPSALGAPPESANQASGLLKVSRHPSFVAFALFGFAHMVMNGWLGDVIFFATFPALGIIGGKHQDSRKLRALGEPYRNFMNSTSFFPGAALVAGRQKWTAADIPWIGVLVGLTLTIATLLLHPMIFGGNPLG